MRSYRNATRSLIGRTKAEGRAIRKQVSHEIMAAEAAIDLLVERGDTVRGLLAIYPRTPEYQILRACCVGRIRRGEA